VSETMTAEELNKGLAALLRVDLGARTDEDIIKAIDSGYVLYSDGTRYIWNGNRHETPCLSYTELWRGREGQSYQADIEAHVASWRRDPPNYAGDIVTAMTLGEELSSRSLLGAYADELALVVTGLPLPLAPDGIMVGIVAHASPYDRALAALRALGGEDDCLSELPEDKDVSDIGKRVLAEWLDSQEE